MSDATNPTDMPALIAEARELDRAATKGPWTHEVYDSLEDAHDVGEFTWTEDGKTLGPNKPANVWAVVETIAGQLGSTGLPGSIEVGENNARLIARYRTLCLELADGCERQAKQAAEALEHRKRQALEIDRLEGEVARLQMLWEGAVSAGVGTLRDNHELRAELARVTGERDALIRPCEQCDGKGEYESYGNDPLNKLMHGPQWYSCPACNGTGKGQTS